MQRVTNINFLHTISIRNQEKRASELIYENYFIKFSELSLKETACIHISVEKPVHRRCFIFLFVLFRSACARARKKNPLRFSFYHVRSTHFEEKIEGL